MELLSMYITDYREMDGQTLHFSTRYIISYSKVQGRYYVSIKRNPNYIENFFGYENITNVTALIGQNGAGKTNTLEFLAQNLSNGEGNLEGYYITVIKRDEDDEQGEDKKKGGVFCPRHWVVILEDETNSFELVEIHMDKDGGLIHVERIDAFERTSFVFYSNIFDGRAMVEKEGLIDISTNYLIQNDHKSYTSLSQVDAFKNQELLRQLYFLTSDVSNKHVPFRLPASLSVSIFREDQDALKDKFKEFGLSTIYDALSDTSYLFHRTSGYQDLFLTEIYVAAFFNFIKQDFDRKQPLLQEAFVKLGVVKDIWQEIDQFFYRLVQLENHPYSAKSAKILDFLEFSHRLIEDDVLEVNGQLPFYNLRIGGSGSVLEDFIQRYNSARSFTNFLQFNWHDLSSGQKSWLSIFARFYGLSDEANQTKDRLQKTVIILIDEGDLYFHPEWQRQFFKILLDFLSAIFPYNCLQLIMTSNSPFIVSDLPKSYINFIDKQKTILPMINKREETFASNIHTLFADSFFMEQVMIGDFAKYKLDSIIDYLQSQEYNQVLSDQYRPIVALIGEPVLKYKIEELWIEKLGPSEEILILESRIKELRNRQNG